MATRDDLLKELENLAERVIVLNRYTEPNSKDYYDVIRYYWYDQSMGVLRSESVIIHVIVKDGKEYAYWKDKIPTVIALQNKEPTFTEELKPKLDTIKLAKGIKAIVIETIDDENKTAILRAYVQSETGKYSEKKVVVWKDESGWNYELVE